MDIGALNEKVLSGGMRRGAWIAELNRRYTQPPIAYTEGARQQKDIPYATESERQKLDLYLPEGAGPFPLVVWVHGGGWFMGHRSDFGLGYSLPWLNEGYAVASIGYRLADEAVFPGPVEDVLAGLAHLCAHAGEYGLDTGRMAFISGSAGTPMAAIAALRCTPRPKAVVLKCPFLDLASIHSQFDAIGLARQRFAWPEEDTSIEALFLGGSVLERPAECAEAAALRYVDEAMPPFLLIHGMEDIDTPYLQSAEFKQLANAIAGEGRVTAMLLPGTGHDGGLFETAEVVEAQVDFIKRHTTAPFGAP